MFTRCSSQIKVASCETNLFCGSAGTYSVLQPKIAYQLRDRKLRKIRATSKIFQLARSITHNFIQAINRLRKLL